MLAFENGTITEEMFGERVRDLSTKAAALRSRRDDLRAALDAGGRSPLADCGGDRRSPRQPA